MQIDLKIEIQGKRFGRFQINLFLQNHVLMRFYKLQAFNILLRLSQTRFQHQAHQQGLA
jgi:hypothetical protein